MATKRKAREGSAGRFDKDDLIKESLRLIKKERLCFVDDIAALLPCSRRTFYNMELHKVHDIKDSLDSQKINKKRSLRNRWEDSENATLQVGLYKLLANDDELERLNNSKQKTEVIIKDDRTEAEIIGDIKKLKTDLDGQAYDITEDE